ncbi:MAG: C2 family cysteine protease [Pirellulales bacterium]
MKKPRKHRPRRLQYENLEPREVMTVGVTASLNAAGVLSVFGTGAGDDIKIQQSASRISVNDVAGSWTARSVKSIVVHLNSGDDYLYFDSRANGGTQKLAEAVTVHSGAGNDFVRWAGGTARINGASHTLAVTSKGKATMDGVAINLATTLTAKLSAGVLTVTGTNGNDNIRFVQNSGRISILGRSGSWTASSVTSIVVQLQEGADNVSFNSQANGGNQTLAETITVRSGHGSTTVRLANGHDVTFHGMGHTLQISANGTATLDGVVLTWDDPTPNPDPDPDPDPTPDPDPSPPAPNWFDSNVQDAALRSLGHNLYTDGLINRGDIVSLLRDAEDGGIIDATELTDLRAIAGASSLFGGAESVQKLTGYVVNTSYANRNYQGQVLGNLAAGSATAQMEKLINKWFFGLDRPVASGTYRQFSGSLFVSGASYTDIHQGNVGDCYFVASLGETAFRNAAIIANMFTVNGDGTYATKFFNGSQSFYVTVDSFLPTNGSGQLVYASRGSVYSNTSNELWVALAEKAYAQLNEFGFTRAGFSDSGQNSYNGINGGYIYAALGHVTGQATSPFAMTSSSSSFTTFVNAYNAGKMIGFASYQTPPAGSGVVGSHAYAVVGYNAAAQTVTLFNPWGTEYGLLTLNWSQIQANFQYFDRTV